MILNQSMEFPKELKPYEEELKKTLKPFIKIETIPESKPKIYESKFGGNPYLPKNTEHPIEPSGVPMILLAQINFEEVPEFQNMPQKGMLQFFISPIEDEDIYYGLDLDNPTIQEHFKVVYHENVITDENLLVTDFSYMDKYGIDYEIAPVSTEVSIKFKLNTQPITATDYRFEQLVESNKVFKQLWDDEDASDCHYEEFYGGHQIEGYSSFTQTDPREAEELQKYDIMLLQIDTDDEVDIMFGDAGIANFFIKSEDLKNLNFKDILYNWDCG